MLQKLQKHITNNFPFLKGKKILIAISGGVDSVVLTHLFQQLNFEIYLAHCNFQLREKESDLDEKFVIELGNNLDLKTFTTKFNTKEYFQKNKLSTQVAARNLRYNWFQELVKKHQFNYILTAHHADDNLETFLINLTRGTGLEGLTGIPSKNENIVRPLLVFSREEIISFAKENKIKWREDASNSETKYLRNKLRLDVVPKLKEINPNLLSSFEKTSTFLQESEQIVNDRIKEVSVEILSKEYSTGLEVTRINIKKIQQLSNPKAYLFQVLKNYGFTEWNDIVKLLTAKSGKQVFSSSHRLIKDRDFLLLSEIIPFKENSTFFIAENHAEISKPISLKLEEISEIKTKNKQTIYINRDVLNFPLIVRKWKNGDYFYPSGMTGKKKLSKYFKDEKLSILAKENVWLLCSAENEVIWIINYRQDNRFLTTQKTKNILKITTNY